MKRSNKSIKVMFGKIRVVGGLFVETLSSGRRVKLAKPFVVLFDRKFIAVPEGFGTDYASVPRIFWSILPPTGKYSKAAVVHDYLYFTADVERKMADKIFLAMMKHLRVSLWKRSLMYSAVRVGGWHAWNQHRKANKGAA